MSMNEANKEAIERNNGLNVLVSSTGCWGEPLGNEKLPIGTKVVYTNDYGVSFPGRTIIRVEQDEYGDAYYTDAVYITKADGTKVLQWAPYRRRNLTIEYIPTTH